MKTPIMPEQYLDENVEPRPVVLPVPDGEPGVEDLASIRADGRIDPAVFDVPDHAARLLREYGEPVTKREAQELGAEVS